jgi:GT2 family glycosyltransferase
MDPVITVSLVAWNGMRWLPGCLESLATQSLDGYELLIIDNASTDGSVEWLREQAGRDGRIRLVESDTNTGYARAHNRSIRAAQGDAVLLLNQDVVLDPGFLAAALATLRKHPEAGSVQARLRRLGPYGEPTMTLDTTGLLMHRDRRVVSRDQLRTDAGSERPPAPVWGADGAAPVYRRAALLDARLPRRGGGWEVLDEDFFAQKEDVDLAWRLHRLGWTCRYEPAALAWHARTGGDTGPARFRDAVRANMANSPRTRVLSWRNQRLMQIKNDEPAAVLRDLPWIARRELQTWLFMLALDQRRLVALPELLRMAPWAIRKRRALTAAMPRRVPAT